jgi:hypothetical protein
LSRISGEWDVHFGQATGSGGIHRGHNPVNVSPQGRPLLIADHHERDLSARQVLLVAHVFVRRQQKLEPRRLSSRYQFAVDKPVPSAMASTTT